METVHINNLRPGQYINHNGEVITLEQAKKLLESGAKPVLHTVSDEYIGSESLIRYMMHGRPARNLGIFASLTRKQSGFSMVISML